jgi:hypothetical protein
MPTWGLVASDGVKRSSAADKAGNVLDLLADMPASGQIAAMPLFVRLVYAMALLTDKLP